MLLTIGNGLLAVEVEEYTSFIHCEFENAWVVVALRVR
jgi:hypothetical protein